MVAKPPKPAPRPKGAYPGLGDPQFSFQSFVRQAIESQKPVTLELMTGETLPVVLLREDQFSLTVFLNGEVQVVYKHSIKRLIFSA